MNRYRLTRKNGPHSVSVKLSRAAGGIDTSVRAVCDASVLPPRASYDTSAPNAKRKSQDEGETDEDKMEEYKASGDPGSFMAKKK